MHQGHSPATLPEYLEEENLLDLRVLTESELSLDVEQ